MVAFIQKAHDCIFFCYAIKAQAAQLAISDSRSVLQEQRWNNQGQAVTRSTANEPGRLGDQSRRMDRIRSRITKDVIERLWLN
jgi:hypothetical protein